MNLNNNGNFNNDNPNNIINNSNFSNSINKNPINMNQKNYLNMSNIPTKANSVSSQTQAPHIHTANNELPTIRDVWIDNLEEEFKYIMNLAEKYKVVGMDTEFPGIVYRLNEGDLQSTITTYNDIEYKTIKMNVDRLKVIQVGLSFTDENGYLPQGVSTWQFNFKFDLKNDEYAKDAIELLSNSGINFAKHQSHGINPQTFAEYLISSGLVLNEDIKWISFHGGFDFAYLIKMLCGINLPDDDENFYKILNIYFPNFYDVKYMTKEFENLKGSGLSKLAFDLNVKRIGPQHQAGSDSLLTIATYFRLREVYLKNVIETKHSNVLYGIGGSNEEFNEYLQNYIENYPGVMFNGYHMNNMGSLLNNSYYSQASDPLFNSMPNNYHNFHYNMAYSNFAQTPYIENQQKSKKYDQSIGKSENRK